jgi:hypothetical protein
MRCLNREEFSYDVLHRRQSLCSRLQFPLFILLQTKHVGFRIKLGCRNVNEWNLNSCVRIEDARVFLVCIMPLFAGSDSEKGTYYLSVQRGPSCPPRFHDGGSPCLPRFYNGEPARPSPSSDAPLAGGLYLCRARLSSCVCVLTAFYSADFLLFHPLLFVDIFELRV